VFELLSFECDRPSRSIRSWEYNMALVTPLICHEQRLGVDPKSGITKTSLADLTNSRLYEVELPGALEFHSGRLAA